MNRLFLINLSVSMISTMIVSCQKAESPERLETLDQLNKHLEESNFARMSTLKNTIIEGGGIEADEGMMDELESIIPLFSIIKYLTKETKFDELMSVVEALDSVTHMDSWYYTERIKNQMSSVKRMSAVYLQSHDTLDLELLISSMHLLKSSFIEDRQMKIYHPTYEPIQVDFFVKNITPNLDKPFKAIITLEKPIDEELFEISEERMEITINGEAIEDYELSGIGSGGWFISFIPTQKGRYILRFTGQLRVLMDKEVGLLKFIGTHELFVK